jgi:putative endonuclease
MHLVYLLRCADGTLYTGYTTDLARRLAQHNAGKGAKYTRTRRPVTPLAAWAFSSKGQALSAEYRIRKLRPAQKQVLIAEGILPPELGALGAHPVGSEHAENLSGAGGRDPLPPAAAAAPAS